MPFIRTAIPQDTSAEQREAIVQGIHDALVSSIGMPEDELFNLVSPYAAGQFFFDRRFNGVARSERVIVVEITMRRGRSDAMKRTLYSQIAQNLAHRANVAPDDIFIFMHENDYSDWSVGNGRFAMALVQQPGAGAWPCGILPPPNSPEAR
jgi:phenylpyruvate tautomerase PptA (4-oxalocrotonate tautomerase family)